MSESKRSRRSMTHNLLLILLVVLFFGLIPPAIFHSSPQKASAPFGKRGQDDAASQQESLSLLQGTPRQEEPLIRADDATPARCASSSARPHPFQVDQSSTEWPWPAPEGVEGNNYDSVHEFHELCEGSYPIIGTGKEIEHELRSRALCSRALTEVSEVSRGRADVINSMLTSGWFACARLMTDPLPIAERHDGPDAGAAHRHDVEKCADEFSQTYDRDREWRLGNPRLHIPDWVWSRVEFVEERARSDESLYSTDCTSLSCRFWFYNLPQYLNETGQPLVRKVKSTSLGYDGIYEVCRYHLDESTRWNNSTQSAWDVFLDVSAQRLCSDAMTAIELGLARHWPPDSCKLLFDYGGAAFLGYDERVKLVRTCANAVNAETYSANVLHHFSKLNASFSLESCVRQPFFIDPTKGLDRFKARNDNLWMYEWEPPFLGCVSPFCNDRSSRCRRDHELDFTGRLASYQQEKPYTLLVDQFKQAQSTVRHLQYQDFQLEHSMCFQWSSEGGCLLWWNATTGEPVSRRDLSHDCSIESQIVAGHTRLFCTFRLQREPSIDDEDDFAGPRHPPVDKTLYVDPRKGPVNGHLDPADQAQTIPYDFWDCAPFFEHHSALRENRFAQNKWLRAQKWKVAQSEASGKGLGQHITEMPSSRHP